jgi:2-polyprenyl-3-methyl-5-hydroxy-6-metoxy-1,4-benzoquinol methylase
MVKKNCPLCNRNDVKILFEFHDSPYQSIIPASILECSYCKLIYKSPHIDAPITNYYNNEQFAEHVYFGNESVSNSELMRILNYIKASCPGKKTLIDFGCGAGYFLKLAINAGYSVSGIEINNTLATSAQKELKVKIVNKDICEYNDNDYKYDIVTMLDFIEHLENPSDILKKSSEILEPEGYIVLYTPNHRSLLVIVSRILSKITGKLSFVYPIFNDLHLVYFDKKTLKKIVEDSGYEVLKTKMIKYNPDRTGIAKGFVAFGLKLIEFISSIFNMQYRILLIAKKYE